MGENNAPLWLKPTQYDPNQNVRCGDQVSHEVCIWTGFPLGQFDACLDHLQRDYNWMLPLVRKYCNQGKLAIYTRKHQSFIQLSAFKLAFEADPDTAEDLPPLPCAAGFYHMVDEENLDQMMHEGDE